ncbi:hypothetical protein J437_LFUL014232, partial [Ladona fulva]
MKTLGDHPIHHITKGIEKTENKLQKEMHGFDRRKITASLIPEIKTEEYKENKSHVQPSSTCQSTKERIDYGLQDTSKSRGRQVMAVTSRGTKAEEYNQEDDHIPPPSAKTTDKDGFQIVQRKKKNRKEGFKSSKTRDAYGLTNELVKHVIHVIAFPLSVVFNNCLQSRTFPDELKYTKTFPNLKKGDPKDPDNNRPISVVPILGKILETIMKIQINDHFEKNSLFSTVQYGFQPNTSTEIATEGIISKILDSFEWNELTSLTLCDLSKAFDCVSHAILKQKL